MTISKRQLLRGAAALGALALRTPLGRGPAAARAAEAVQLAAAWRTLEVKGKPAKVMGLHQADGTAGVFLDPGERFLVQLANHLEAATIIHWHGQDPPVGQDGVAMLGLEALIAPGAVQGYDFAPRPGTHWMHSHQGLQEMQLLAAPLVVRTAEDRSLDAQEITVLLQDFTFRSPEEVMAGLNAGAMPGMKMGEKGMDMPGMKMADMPGMKMEPGGKGMDMPGMGMGEEKGGGAAEDAAATEDFNDIDFDAYLANDRTLEDPLVVRTERRGRVRLRLINAGSATGFWIDLGTLVGTVLAVDGNPVAPVRGRRFPLAEAQRLDLLVEVPAGQACPILAQRVGDTARTGIVLAAPDARIRRIEEAAAAAAGGLDNGLERQLVALAPLPPRPVDRRHTLTLTGSMKPYQWFINGRGWDDREPVRVKQGERVALDFVNKTRMAHPMHLHGHSFQVVALNGKPLQGAVRDTIEVPPWQSASVVFDADNPGRWLIHCHILTHMETGMVTEVAYES
jgi:FtsP/CotA-like multicopper oxidase with cupredoxin domain